LNQLEDWLKTLEVNPVTEPGSLRDFNERLAELKTGPDEHWYDESRLEAGETLRDELRTEIRGLATDLDAAASAIEGHSLRGGGGLEGALRGLESRALALHPDLLKRLKDAMRGGRALDSSSLARQLREGAGFCRATLRECREGDRNCIAVAQRGAVGRGGAERGPGTAPLTLDPEAEVREPGRLEGVSSDDLRQAALGDLVGTSQAAPRADRRAPIGTAGGRAAAATGGQPVGRSILTPEERRVLDRYFAQ
jgi:hypothetical protein